ncbi:GntR family transcriptional regulator [Candidatus Bipolaricaulota bacterium]|nr:GntR family transcriptional regulator [Candidatus Bipolaricaulota bacterium]
MDGRDAKQLLTNFADRTRIQLVGDSQIPLYYQLARILHRFIQDDLLKAGDRFPSEEAVGACFGVSRPTVNKAIQELLTEGWLTRVRGRGTFVQEDPRVQLALLSNTLSPIEQFSPQALRYKLVQKKVEAAIPHINQLLGLEPDEPLLYLRRLRLLHEHPLLVCDSILPADRFPRLGERPFINGSLYATLNQEYGCPILRSERSVEAAEVVEREVADLLQVPLLSPALLLTGVTFTEGDEPIEYISSYLKEGLSLKSMVQGSASELGRGTGSEKD